MERLPLHFAVSAQASVEVVRALLEAHPEGAREKVADGWLPLHVAIDAESSVEVLTVLVEASRAGEGERVSSDLLYERLAKTDASRATLASAVHAANRAAWVRDRVQPGWLPLSAAARRETPADLLQALLEWGV